MQLPSLSFHRRIDLVVQLLSVFRGTASCFVSPNEPAISITIQICTVVKVLNSHASAVAVNRGKRIIIITVTARRCLRIKRRDGNGTKHYIIFCTRKKIRIRVETFIIGVDIL